MTKDFVQLIKVYPVKCALLILIVIFQIHSFLSYKFIWPLSHATVMFSRPLKFPLIRLYLQDEYSGEVLNSDTLVPRPSKISYIYYHYPGERNFQKFLEELLHEKKEFSNKKVVLMLERIERDSPLCTEGLRERAACLDQGKDCYK